MSAVPLDSQKTLEQELGEDTMERLDRLDAERELQSLSEEEISAILDVNEEAGFSVFPVEVRSLDFPVVAFHDRGCGCQKIGFKRVWDENCADKNLKLPIN
jgi:hypothetical protein